MESLKSFESCLFLECFPVIVLFVNQCSNMDTFVYFWCTYLSEITIMLVQIGRGAHGDSAGDHERTFARGF